MPNSIDQLIELATSSLQRLGSVLPSTVSLDWSTTRAALWQRSVVHGGLRAHQDLDDVKLEDLLHIDQQKALIDANTRQFVRGYPANNVLLWGARGSGKSSLIHALLNQYGDAGLRLIEVDKESLAALAEMVATLRSEPYRFLVVCDDLSFDGDDSSYRELKSALEGSVFRTSRNVLIYATSNRRHLLPEYMSDNRDVVVGDAEIHQSEAVEEKISLSDRFGIWLAFRAFKQDAYLDVVSHWLRRIGAEHGLDVRLTAAARAEALQWALARGARNGRTANYFARHWVGRELLRADP
ncbi:MAG: ATP-binding protein [Gammaproteobacteria bacterium]|nr:ATP-binding protein [Gammaproteobacteria bacterium]